MKVMLQQKNGIRAQGKKTHKKTKTNILPLFFLMAESREN